MLVVVAIAPQPSDPRSPQGDRGFAFEGPVMPVRHVFLARHGETDWNVAGRWQGHTDVPLNATGRAQAALLAERLRAEGLAAVASSASR